VFGQKTPDLLGIGEGLEEFWLATNAYIYGYPLVTMEYTRQIMTNVAAPEGMRGPMLKRRSTFPESLTRPLATAIWCWRSRGGCSHRSRV
jgi:hypothetical protein